MVEFLDNHEQMLAHHKIYNIKREKSHQVATQNMYFTRIIFGHLFDWRKLPNTDTDSRPGQRTTHEYSESRTLRVANDGVYYNVVLYRLRVLVRSVCKQRC